MKTADHFGRTGEEFRAYAEAVEAGIGQFIGLTGEGRFVHAQIIGKKIVERFLAGKIGGVFENFRAKMLGEADDFKEMAVAIAGEGGDTHARKNFSQAGVHGGAGFFGAAGFEGLGKFIGEIGDDGAGASGDEESDVVGVKDLGGFDDQWNVPEAFAHHGFPDGGGGEERRERRAIGADGAIRKEEEPRAPAAAQRGSRKLSKTAARPRNSGTGRKSNIDLLLGAKDRGELRKLAGGNHGTGQGDSVFQVDIQRHDVGFAQGIDRRIGDLRETLFAVIPQSSGERGKKCGRRVVAHAPVGFFAVSEGGKKNFELVFGPSGGASDALWLVDGDCC